MNYTVIDHRMDLCSQWALKRFPEDMTFEIERKIMSNIKITAEVDGKQVPLETVSTETFEAIKALEKPKEIPVARVGYYRGSPNDKRLFLRINEQLRKTIANNKYIRKVTIDLKDGNAVWQSAVDDAMRDDLYENIQSL